MILLLSFNLLSGYARLYSTEWRGTLCRRHRHPCPASYTGSLVVLDTAELPVYQNKGKNRQVKAWETTVHEKGRKLRLTASTNFWSMYFLAIFGWKSGDSKKRKKNS